MLIIGPAGSDNRGEGARSLQRHGEVPGEDTGEDPVGERPHLLGPGRLGDARDRVPHLGEPDARGILPARLDRLTTDPLPQRIQPPQGTRQASGRPPCPEVGDRREPQVVDERDEAGGDCGIGGGATRPHDDRGGLVGDLGDLGRAGQGAAVGFEGIRPEVGRPPRDVASAVCHQPILPRTLGA